MKIAVAYKDGEIFEHFGHCECFAVYEYDFERDAEKALDNVQKTLIDVTHLHGHEEMANLMRDEKIDAVISGNMGAGAKSMLLSYGIVPVVGYCGPADLAADLLVTGRLPISPDEAGGCGGGCGGGCSGGCCGGDDDGCGSGGCCGH